MCVEKTKEKTTQARSLASPGLVGAAHICDMRVNGLPNSGPLPCGGTASFCRFIFYVLADKL